MKCYQCNRELTTGDTMNAFGICNSCHTDNLFKTAHPLGWECPNCHVIHSPWTPDCYCKTNHGITITYSDGTSNNTNGGIR